MTFTVGKNSDLTNDPSSILGMSSLLSRPTSNPTNIFMPSQDAKKPAVDVKAGSSLQERQRTPEVKTSHTHHLQTGNAQDRDQAQGIKASNQKDIGNTQAAAAKDLAQTSEQVETLTGRPAHETLGVYKSGASAVGTFGAEVLANAIGFAGLGSMASAIKDIAEDRSVKNPEAVIADVKIRAKHVAENIPMPDQQAAGAAEEQPLHQQLEELNNRAAKDRRIMDGHLGDNSQTAAMASNEATAEETVAVNEEIQKDPISAHVEMAGFSVSTTEVMGGNIPSFKAAQPFNSQEEYKPTPAFVAQNQGPGFGMGRMAA